MAVAVDRAGSERRALADQADQTELERARLAVLEQRARFARELHDMVAHHMSPSATCCPSSKISWAFGPPTVLKLGSKVTAGTG
jgi:hypothetical protein